MKPLEISYFAQTDFEGVSFSQLEMGEAFRLHSAVEVESVAIYIKTASRGAMLVADENPRRNTWPDGFRPGYFEPEDRVVRVKLQIEGRDE